MKNKPNTKYQHDSEFWYDEENVSVHPEELTDKHYHKIVYPVELYFNEKKRKWMKHKVTRFYSSGDTGSLIRDALTGHYYNVTVGSLEEENFFKVRMLNKYFEFPVTAFYSSPEEFEREHFTKLSDKTIERWHKRNAKRD